MRITSTQLRQIIREELARSMNEMDLQLAVPYIARKKKKKPAPPQAPLSPMTDRMMKANYERSRKVWDLRVLEKDLSKVDADYVKDILPTVHGMYAPVIQIIDWAGPELRAKIEELARDYSEAHHTAPTELRPPRLRRHSKNFKR